jgi:hypothetical protein
LGHIYIVYDESKIKDWSSMDTGNVYLGATLRGFWLKIVNCSW